MCYFVYIIYSDKLDAYYKGQTKDLVDRLSRHNNGYEKSTKGGVPWIIVWATKKQSRPEAVMLETRLKNLSRERIKKFIEHHPEGITCKITTAGPDALKQNFEMSHDFGRGQDADTPTT